MNDVTRRCASALAAALASLSVAKAASAESRSVAVVAPDPQLLRALDVALAPWGTNITEVHPIESPTAMAPDRARAIARETRADVVLWVSADGGHQTVWIYDVASDHVSSRRVEATPPFDPTTAAAVALSVKALLRSTVVAPLPERTAPVSEEPSWALGVSAGFADHLTEVAGHVTQGPEGRFGLHASVWPAIVSHELGVVLDASIGTGVDVQVPAQNYNFTYTLHEYEFEVGVGARLAASPTFALEPSLSAAVVLIQLDGTLTPVASSGASAQEHAFRVAAGFQSAVAVSLTPPGTRLRIAPWVGFTLLTLGVGYQVQNGNLTEASRYTPEGGIRAELAWP
jgi:hypothetical protein